MTHGTKDSVCTYPGYGVPQLQDFAKLDGCTKPDPAASATAFEAALPEPTSTASAAGCRKRRGASSPNSEHRIQVCAPVDRPVAPEACAFCTDLSTKVRFRELLVQFVSRLRSPPALLAPTLGTIVQGKRLRKQRSVRVRDTSSKRGAPQHVRVGNAIRVPEAALLAFLG